MNSVRPLVLIVEDDHVIRLVAINQLKRLAEVDIKLAHNGKEAVDLAKQYRFALILMDIHMPEMDGLEASRRIRAADRELGRYTPIVAVTASDSRDHCLLNGLDDYIQKPADYQRIVRRWLPSESRKFA